MDAASAASACPSAKDFDKVLRCSRAAGGDHGNVDRIHHRSRQFAIKAVAHAIAINRGKQYFARPALFRFSGPCHRIASGSLPAARRLHSEMDNRCRC